MNTKSAYGYAYLIAFLYVGLGTLSVLSMYPDNLFYREWVVWVLLITVPVNFISWGILYADPTQQLLVIFIQFLIFILIGQLIFAFFFKKQVSR